MFYYFGHKVWQTASIEDIKRTGNHDCPKIKYKIHIPRFSGGMEKKIVTNCIEAKQKIKGYYFVCNDGRQEWYLSVKLFEENKKSPLV